MANLLEECTNNPISGLKSSEPNKVIHSLVNPPSLKKNAIIYLKKKKHSFSQKIKKNEEFLPPSIPFSSSNLTLN